MEYIFICAFKILGFPFAVLTEEEAKRWVDDDPESHYYDKIPVKQYKR
jgi:hypothetical protein